MQTHKKLFYHKGALILKPKYFYEIYYWIGDTNNIKNNFTVCYYSTLLSSYLKNCQIFREESGEESEQFKKILN